MSECCLIGLGSNLGNRSSILDTALAALQKQLQVTSVSKWYTYPAIGGPDEQADFLNGVVVAETSLSALEVADFLHELETQAGRKRFIRWSSRTLDCDLLLFGEHQLDMKTLQVPHPRMIARRFVLEPANEVASEMLHPQLGWTIGRLYLHLQEAWPYFCVIGSDPQLSDLVAQRIASEMDSPIIKADLPFAGSNSKSALEWWQKAQDLFPEGRPSTGLISTFWIREPWLYHDSLPIHGSFDDADMAPKLIIVTDPLDSDFGRRFARLDRRLRRPTLFLSTDRQQAIQDAVGAVLAMK